MRILVTGGAGYIGSAAVKALVQNHDVVVVDNLSNGLLNLVDKKATFHNVDLTDVKKLSEVFKERFDAVMHFAAYKLVGESMENPAKYSDNITGTINLLNLMVKHKVKRIIYSSSAAVYGEPKYVPIDEKHPTAPVNYYGFTKLECERIIQWYSRIHGISFVSLRYFNVAGDAGLNYIDPRAENIVPVIMEVITGKREKLVIFGKDYDTDDGTCIRDYIDINDLVKAHIMALNVRNEIINLGSSQGISVKQLVDTAIKVTGKGFDYDFGPRRKGDPCKLLASNEKAKSVLGWKPEKSVKEMIESAYRAYNA